MSLKDNLSSVTVEIKGKKMTAVEYLAKTQPKRVRSKAFTNGISRNLELPEPEPDFTQWVLICGVQYLRAAKEPIAHSGKSLKGAIQYDPDTDRIKCHGCGCWLVAYSQHWKKCPDGLSPRLYRIKHGLTASTPLCGMRYRQKMSEVARKRNEIHGIPAYHGRMKGSVGTRKPFSVERQNAISNCFLQLPEKAKAMERELGRTPSLKEFKAAGVSLATVKRLFGSFNEFIKSSGLQPRNKPISHPVHFSDSELIHGLVAFKKLRDCWPKKRDMHKSAFLRPYQTYVNRFGGLPQAIAKAESRLQA